MPTEVASYTSPIRVLVADEYAIVRRGLIQEITQQPDMRLVGEATNGPEALQMAQTVPADVLLLDTRLPGLNGVQIARQLLRPPFRADKGGGNRPQLLVFTVYRDRQYVWSLLAAGARGYLLKDEPLPVVMDAIRLLAQGHTALSLPIQTMLVELIPALNQTLSQREVAILRLLAQGKSHQEIAESLAITEKTVRNHLHNAYRKVPTVKSQAEAIAWTWINRLVVE